MCSCDAVNHSANRRIVVVIVLIDAVALVVGNCNRNVEVGFAIAIALAHGCHPCGAFIMPSWSRAHIVAMGSCGCIGRGTMNEKFSENLYARHNCCCAGIVVAGQEQIKSMVHERTRTEMQKWH